MLLRNALIGLVAGLASALLSVSILSGSALSLMLYPLATLPIMVAGLGWTHHVGLLAACVSAIVLALLFGNASGALVSFLTSGLPAWGLAYLTLLARSDKAGSVVEWFPVGHVVLITVLLSAAGNVIVAFVLGPSFGEYTAALTGTIESMLRLLAGTPRDMPLTMPDVQDPQVLVRFLAGIVLPLAAGIGAFVTLFNLWLAARIVRASGRLPRPWPDIAAMRLPRWAPVALGLALAAALLTREMAGVAAAILAAALVTAFAIAGFACVHYLTRGRPGRPFTLGALYCLTFVLNWVAVAAVALFGLLDQLFDLRARADSRRGPPLNPKH